MSKRILVVISGNGSNLQAIIDSQNNGDIDGNIVAVVSNKPNAFGLERANNAGIDAVCVDHTLFDDKASFETAMRDSIDSYSPDLIVLAGFMRILSSEFVQHYLGKIINIHPSLLPKYKGLHTHRRVLENKDKEHGTSVHFVTAELDGGPIIAQNKVTVDENDTEESLQAKIQVEEHALFPQVIAWFCSNQLHFADGQAVLSPEIR